MTMHDYAKLNLTRIGKI